MVQLDICGVRFSYGPKEILKDVSFSASQGSIVGIIGQNGSGKTTLLNCINAELSPGKGCVRVSSDGFPDLGDTDVRRLSDRQRSQIFATVEQNSSASFPFTVYETVAMGRYSHSTDEDEDLRIVHEAMEVTGTLRFSDRKVNELSGGEWRRVMIAQALVQQPEVLLLDEPTLHLDINHQFELMDLLKEINSRGEMLIVIVTHDLPLASRYCDRVILMENGSIVSMGDTGDVITPDSIARVFRMRARVDYDPDIGGMNVTMIGKIQE